MSPHQSSSHCWDACCIAGKAAPRRPSLVLPFAAIEACLVLELAASCLRASAVVFSAELDAELATLHAASEEGWARLDNLTLLFRTPASVGVQPGSAFGSGLPPATAPQSLGSDSVSHPPAATPVETAPTAVAVATTEGAGPLPMELLQAIRKLQSEFTNLQEQAFRIGRESPDNDALARHPLVNDYVQSMREWNTKLATTITDVEHEYKRLTGKPIYRQKKRKRPKTVQGLSREDIEARSRAAVVQDQRQFRTKAMELASLFRERQMQTQDKQQDLQREMDGPDWPTEDWPLSSADAKNVGEAEQIMQTMIQDLNAKLNPLGGLARVHESEDESALEQIAALNEVMAAYIELIDRHVETVKRIHRNNRRKKPRATKPKTVGAGRPSTDGTAAPLGSGTQFAAHSSSLRDRLLDFGRGSGSAAQRNSGSQASGRRPFDWLTGPPTDGGLQSAPAEAGARSGMAGEINTGSFGNAAAPNALGGFGAFGAPVLSGSGGFGADPSGRIAGGSPGTHVDRNGVPQGLGETSEVGAGTSFQRADSSGVRSPLGKPLPGEGSFGMPSAAGISLGDGTAPHGFGARQFFGGNVAGATLGGGPSASMAAAGGASLGGGTDFGSSALGNSAFAGLRPQSFGTASPGGAFGTMGASGTGGAFGRPQAQTALSPTSGPWAQTEAAGLGEVGHGIGGTSSAGSSIRVAEL